MSTDELNRLFAEKVVGRHVVTVDDVRHNRADIACWFTPEAATAWRNRWSSGCAVIHLPDFCASADAVLPWLERERKEAGRLVEAGMTAYVGRIVWVIRIVDNETNQQCGGEAETFAHAAVLALLRAKEVLV